MRLGVSIPQTGRLAEAALVRAVAGAAEQVGYDALWAADRPQGGSPMLDTAAALATAAAGSDGLRFGAVLSGPWSPGAGGHVLQRTVALLDRIAPDRLVVALEGTDAAEAAATLPPTSVPVLLCAPHPGDIATIAQAGHGLLLPVTSLHDVETIKAARSHLLEAAAADHEPAARQLMARLTVELTTPLAQHEGLAAVTTAGIDAVDEVVVSVAGDPTLDELLATYAAVAEALDSPGQR